MPALNLALTDDEPAGITDAIRGSVPPPEMCTFIRYMVPSMKRHERVDMLGGMHDGAPPETFETFAPRLKRQASPEGWGSDLPPGSAIGLDRGPSASYPK